MSMDKSPTQPLSAYLLKAHKLAQITEKVHVVQRLDYILQQYLDQELQQHCTLGNYHTHCLTIVADTGSYATRVRFSSRQLLHSLRTHPEFADLQKIRCRVRPPVAPLERPARRQPRQLSQRTISTLKQAASHIQDPALREALAKLAGKS